MARRQLNWVSDQTVLKHTLSGSYRFSPSLTVAAGASTRQRNHHLTDYSMRANSAHAGVAYKPTKHWSLNARLYGRATKTDENTQSPQYTRTGTHAGKDSIDYYSYKGDLKARYTGFKRVALSLGYKPEHTFRRNAGEFVERATFASEAVYQDRTIHLAGEKENPTEAKDTRQTFSAKAEFELPEGAGLSLALTELTANRGGYQAMPTRSSNQTAALTVPVTPQTQLLATVGLTYAANSTASFAKYKRRTGWLQVGGQWTDPEDRGSLGTFYGYEHGRDQFNAFWGDKTVTPGNAPLIHIWMPHLYNNHTLSASGDAKLSKGFRLDGDITYARSEGHYPTDGIDFKLQGGAVLTDYNPTDIQTSNLGVGLTYAPTEDLTARLGYRQDFWFDNLLVDDNGQSRMVTLTASAKF